MLKFELESTEHLCAFILTLYSLCGQAGNSGIIMFLLRDAYEKKQCEMHLFNSNRQLWMYIYAHSLKCWLACEPFRCANLARMGRAVGSAGEAVCNLFIHSTLTRGGIKNEMRNIPSLMRQGLKRDRMG